MKGTGFETTVGVTDYQLPMEIAVATVHTKSPTAETIAIEIALCKTNVVHTCRNIINRAVMIHLCGDSEGNDIPQIEPRGKLLA